MRKLKLTLLVMAPVMAFAQLPEDALRYGFPLMGGTARNLAIGGAMGSLGGDITAAHINPAGIGLYKNAEVVLTPGFAFNNNRWDYRGTDTRDSKSGFGYGTSGIVVGKQAPQWKKASSSAFSVSINQIANYNNSVTYNGFNNASSWSEQYVEELVRDRATIQQAENNYIFGSSLAFWTFLVDTIANAQGNVIGYQSLVPLPRDGNPNQGVNQFNQINTQGGAHEVSVAFANSYNDKLHLGMSFNMPFYSFRKTQRYREEDASGNPDNDFAYFEYNESYRTNGVGLNAKLGLIYRPVEKLRLGFAFHTPTFGTFTDEISSRMETNTENYTVFPQPQTKSSDELRGNSNAGRFEYNLMTPMRVLGSASYVISEVRDVTRQRGFVTADVEYVNYRGIRYSSANTGSADDDAYYRELNEIIREQYRGALNLRVGGEMKFKTLMARAGAAFMGSPYADPQQRLGRRTLLSGGLGYRNYGMFVDLTYVHAFIQDTHVPYRLADKPSPIADARNNRGNIVLTFGFKI